jgi:Mn-dependent DtxR family transcriptional regulator
MIPNFSANPAIEKSGDFEMKRNQSREDYLETIFLLGREGGPVHAADIAKAMKYSPVSVGNALARLLKDATIRMDSMKHIYLTEKGYVCAVKTYEKHIFFMNLLMSMGVEKEEASDMACSIEHTVSDKTFEFIKEAINKKPCGRLGFCPGVRVENHDVPHTKKSRKKTSEAVQTESDASYAFPGANAPMPEF